MSAALKPSASDSNLLAVVNATHAQHIKPAADVWRDALLAARAEPDDIDRNVAKLIIAAEALGNAAEHVCKVLRAELLASMEHDGVTSFDIPHFSISRRNATVLAVITDIKALAAAHPDLLTEQEPKPDRAEIARRLKKGQTIAGASLSNGGPNVLTITAKK